MSGIWVCTYLSNLFRYSLGLIVLMGQAGVFTNSVQRYPMLIAVVFGILDDNAICDSGKRHICSRLAIIVQLDFVHVL